MDRYELIYDYCTPFEDVEPERDLHEIFEGSWDDLQQHIGEMKMAGCYHIDVACISEEV